MAGRMKFAGRGYCRSMPLHDHHRYDARLGRGVWIQHETVRITTAFGLTCGDKTSCTATIQIDLSAPAGESPSVRDRR